MQVGSKLFFELIEALLWEVDKIHFIDHHKDLRDAEKRTEIGMLPSLVAKAFLRVNQKNGCFCLCRSADHIFQKFFVARSINNREMPILFTLAGWELNFGDINRNPLFLFFLECIQQKSVFKWSSLLITEFFYFLDCTFRQSVGSFEKSSD